VQAELIPQNELPFCAQLTEGECRAWRKPPDSTVSQWAEENRQVTTGQFTGPWRNELTPYLPEIMDTWQLTEVRVTSIMAPTQSGKTQAMNNCWAYGATVLNARSLWTLPDEDSATETLNDLGEIIKGSEKLARLLTGSPRDISKKAIKLIGSKTYAAWSTSPKRLARISIEHLFCDEKGKWSGYDPTRPEARPSRLARARLTAYPYTRKEMNCSSPTVPGDEISKDVFEDSQELRVYQARCPDCGKLQIAKLSQLRWDPEIESDPEEVKGKNLAWYECEHCGSPWGQAKMRIASRTGAYGTFIWDAESHWFIPVPPKENPVSVGFHYSSFYSFATKLGEITSAAIKAGYRINPKTGDQISPGKNKDIGEEHNLFNTYLALPYRNEESAREETRILIHCDASAEQGAVPTWATHLFICIDVRKLGLDYSLRAWRSGPAGRSRLVQAGFFENLELMERFLRESIFTDGDGGIHHIDLGLADSGYQTDDVYLFCWNNPPMRPSKGWGVVDRDRPFESRRRPSWTSGFKPGKIEQYPGLPLYHLDANHYKNRLHQKLMMEPGQVGSWELHTNMRPDNSDGLLQDYARQLCGERLDERGLWVPVGGGRHDLLDCEYMQIACADIRALNRLTPEDEAKPRATKKAVKNAARQRPSWRKSPRR